MIIEIAALIPAIWGLTGLTAVLFLTRAPRPHRDAKTADMDQIRPAA